MFRFKPSRITLVGILSNSSYLSALNSYPQTGLHCPARVVTRQRSQTWDEIYLLRDYSSVDMLSRKLVSRLRSPMHVWQHLFFASYIQVRTYYCCTTRFFFFCCWLLHQSMCSPAVRPTIYIYQVYIFEILRRLSAERIIRMYCRTTTYCNYSTNCSIWCSRCGECVCCLLYTSPSPRD